jgi:hypothetical protein
MKSFTLLMMFTVTGFCSFAQIQKNNFLFSGGLSLSRSSSTLAALGVAQGVKVHSNDVAFSPKIGKFISNKIAVGVELPVTAQSIKLFENDGSVAVTKTSGIGLGSFARFYCPIQSKFFLLAEVGINYLQTNSTSRYLKYHSVTNQNIWSFNGGGGLAYLLNNNLSADLILTYRHVTEGNLGGKGNAFLSAQIGFQIFLSRKTTD